ncbi:hypothetical protein NE237_031651 [Protea cynaroides]|uniref:Uncharacterized protein n=1 Tax=Protea cynaroides TaxID=273540 RepID=A0A9Q0L2P4_9MAGN|nr:hypothetical protein NE237_031651 [Protea cynaroides]
MQWAEPASGNREGDGSRLMQDSGNDRLKFLIESNPTANTTSDEMLASINLIEESFECQKFVAIQFTPHVVFRSTKLDSAVGVAVGIASLADLSVVTSLDLKDAKLLHGMGEVTEEGGLVGGVLQHEGLAPGVLYQRVVRLKQRDTEALGKDKVQGGIVLGGVAVVEYALGEFLAGGETDGVATEEGDKFLHGESLGCKEIDLLGGSGR